MSERTREYASWASVVFLFAMALGSSCVTGCAHGNPYDTAAAAITSAEQLQTATIQSFERYDAQHQADLLANARTKAEADTSLRAYRAKRDIVTAAVLKVAAVTTIARTALVMVEDGTRSKTDLDKALADMGAAVASLSGLLTDFDLAGSK